MENACNEIINKIGDEIENKEDLEREKRLAARKYKLRGFPKTYDLMKKASKSQRKKLSKILKIKPTRVISGVNVITVVCKPAPCPGNCIYCPPRSKKVPKSYTGLEPAIQRARNNSYDPYNQIKNRIDQYKLMGYRKANKIEVKILGGTFLSLDKKYKEQFIKRIFDALNDKTADSLNKAKEINETANYRCVGLTVETRPDFCFESDVDELLKYGGTKVEIGVQTIFPKILKKIKREHTVKDTIKANKIARNAGLKTSFHVMPNLPGSNIDRDIEMLKNIFEDSNFRPDYLKIYPTLTMEGTKLYELWKDGKYKPYEREELVELLAKVKKYVPKYCRIQRIGRDIPSTQIAAGCKKTNLREFVKDKAEKLKIKCNCIRCREAGFKARKGIYPETSQIKLYKTEYNACEGREIFLSYEDLKNDILIAFLRLRLPEKSHRSEINDKTALIRELKVTGSSVPIDDLPKKNQWQHKGFGKKLMKEAEKISKNKDKEKATVISAIGTKEYYRKLGYRKDGVYMSKFI